MVFAPDQKIAIFAITAKGTDLARRLKRDFPGSCLYIMEKYSPDAEAGEYAIGPELKESIARAFYEYRYLVLIMATGIAVRILAPLVKDKREDPGVVVIDQEGLFAISLLSGHLGGANRLTNQVAACLGSLPIITTASDIEGTFSVDMLGRAQGWKIENCQNLTAVSAALVNGETVGFFQDAGEKLQEIVTEIPSNLAKFSDLRDLIESENQYVMIVTDRILEAERLARLPSNRLIYRPGSLVVGIGCNRGTESRVIEEAVNKVFEQNGLSTGSISRLATIDLKKDEAGLLEYAAWNKWSIDYFDREQLGKASILSPASQSALQYAGTPSVCEAAAVLSSKGTIVAPKTSLDRAVTVAVARIPFGTNENTPRGRLYIVGTGPGDLSLISGQARAAILKSDVVVGYRTYIELIRPLLVQKKVVSTGMGAEIERMKTALDLAGKGKIVSVISSGDAGVYGMAGLMGEILAENPGQTIDVTVIPGIPALASGAALLGSPLCNDFACISLSDHLVSWDVIQKRLRLAAGGDFVIVIYNPRSHLRPHLLDEARDILLSFRRPDTPAGLVKNAYRAEQSVTLTDLGHLMDFNIDMNTTIIVGNSQTFSVDHWMATPRGYRNKYEVKMP